MKVVFQAAADQVEEDSETPLERGGAEQVRETRELLIGGDGGHMRDETPRAR